MRTRNAMAGEVVIREGDVGDAFYLVGEGELCAYKKGARGPIAMFAPGDSFGELALMYDCPRQATIKSVTASKLFFLTRLPFKSLVSEAMNAHKERLAKRLASVRSLVSLPSAEIKKVSGC